MPNQIGLVEAIKKEMRTGWPYGASEAYKKIPVLIERITELEAALAPFAQVAAKNIKFVHPSELTHVHMNDLIRALEFMDASNISRAEVEDFGLPAE